MATQRNQIHTELNADDNLTPTLDRASKAIRGFDEEMRKTQRGFRMIRGGGAQMSMQIQDIAVQLQSGTNFMTVFAQQGSQIASLFGAGGAFIGALLAVGAAIGGTFLPRLLESKTSAEKLRKELEELGNVMSIDLAEDTFKLTERFRSLATHSEELAKIQLGINLVKANKAATAAISATEEATAEFITRQYTADQMLKGARVSVESYAAAVEGMTVEQAAAHSAFTMNEAVLGKLATKLGINKTEMRLLQDAAIGVRDEVDGAIPAFQALIQQILQNNQGTGKLSDTFLEHAQAVLEAAIAKAEASAQVDRLTGLLENLKGGLDATSDSTLQLQNRQDSFAKGIKDQIELFDASKEAIMKYRAEELGFAEDHEIFKKIEELVALQEGLDQTKQIEKLQQSLMTKEEALKASYDKEIALLNDFGARSAENAELVADLKIRAEERYLAKMEELRKKSKNWEDKTSSERVDMVMGDLDKMFSGVKANNKRMFAVAKAYNIAKAMMSTATGATKALETYPPPLSFAMAAAQVAAGMAQVATIKAQSFDGGGFTGVGSRSGGMDGKGGFMAMLHPNETVVDHSKGQGQGITIINNVDASGAGADVDVKIQQAMQVTSQKTIETVQDLLRRRRM